MSDKQLPHPALVTEMLEGAPLQVKVVLTLYMDVLIKKIVEQDADIKRVVGQRDQAMGLIDEMLADLKEMFASDGAKSSAESLAKEALSKLMATK